MLIPLDFDGTKLVPSMVDRSTGLLLFDNNAM
jgi:hypothetical protein